MEEIRITAGGAKDWIREIFANVVEDMKADELVISKYFDPEYVQHADGKRLDYDDFVAHMKCQKSVLQNVQVTFAHILADGNKIATSHVVKGVKTSGEEIEAHVIAIFQSRSAKLVRCDELTRLTKGAAAHGDLGSRT
jgi:hypothetical protein